MIGGLTFLQMLGFVCLLALGFVTMIAPIAKKEDFFSHFIFEESEESNKQTPLQ